MIGAKRCARMLRGIDLEKVAADIKNEIAVTTSELKPKKLMKRLKIIEASSSRATSPSGWCLTVVSGHPRRTCVRSCRSMAAASRTSDLNDLYRRVINRNNRLKRLIELRAPDIIIRNEKRMHLQERGRAVRQRPPRPRHHRRQQAFR